MTIEEARAQLQQVKKAADEYKSRPFHDLARPLVQAAGKYALLLIQDGAHEHLLGRAGLIRDMICEIEGCEVERSWSIETANSKSVEFRVPRPCLQWEDMLAIYSQLKTRRVRHATDHGPYVGSYVLLLSACACTTDATSARKQDEVTDAIKQTVLGASGDFASTKILTWGAEEFIGWIVEGANDLLLTWQQVKETGSTETAGARRKATDSSESKGFSQDPKEIPSGFYKEEWLEGTQESMSWAFFPKQEAKPHLLKARAAEGDCHVVRIGKRKKCKVFFPTKADFDKAKVNRDRGMTLHERKTEET